MKVFQSVSVLASLIAGQTLAASQDGAKQLFHVTVPKIVFDTALAAFGDELDIWEAALVDKDTVQADVYALESVIAKFYAGDAAATLLRATKNGDDEATPVVQIERDPVNTAQMLEEAATVAAACTSRTTRHLAELQANSSSYTNNAFFDCWRTADEVYAFLDTLVEQNPRVFTKIGAVSTSVEGREILAYKLSTDNYDKPAVYVQGLIHAREWHAGSTTFFAIAALLDGLRSHDAELTALLDEYDWYFVPIVNVDGFAFTHASDGDRLWRKNRREVGSSWWGGATYGVDLNRNFGPLDSFGKGGESPSAETYPGPNPLSEPETEGIYNWIKTLPLVGALDVHAYSGLVLRPLGNQRAQAPAPWGAKLKTLGDNVRDAIEVDNSYSYTSQTAAELYLSYGSFMDAIFLEFNKTATLSFEMEGRGFTPSESVIRPGGLHVFHGIVQFAKELDAYYDGQNHTTGML